MSPGNCRPSLIRSRPQLRAGHTQPTLPDLPVCLHPGTTGPSEKRLTDPQGGGRLWPTARVAREATDKQERDVVCKLGAAVQKQTERSVELAFVGQGLYAGENAKQTVAKNKIELMAVRALGAKRGFVLLLIKWVVERSFAWLAHFLPLVKDCVRMPATLKGLHVAASPSSCWLDCWISLIVRNTL